MTAEQIPHLVLYKKDSCPFCQRVFRTITEELPAPLAEAIEYKDIVLEPANREELIAQGGKAQVPCLFIDGKALYESSEIIEYLKGLA